MKKLRARVTWLEAVSQCWFRYKYEEKDWSWAFETWDIIHMAHQSASLARMWLKKSRIPLDEKMIAEAIIEKLIGKQLKEMKEEYSEWIFETTLKQVRKYEILWEEYELNIEWHADWVGIMYDKDWTEMIGVVDFKTAAKPRSDNYKESTLQKKLYPYMLMEKYGVDKVKFQYVLYIKSTVPYITKYDFVYRKDDIKDEIEKIYRDYVEQEITQDYKAKENIRCFACNLKKEWRCPLFQNTL